MLLNLNVSQNGKMTVVYGVLGWWVSVSVCFWWYFVSKHKRRRNPLPRFIGYLVFGLASAWLMGLIPLLGGISKNYGRVEASLWALGYLVFLTALFVAAYFLQFQRGSDVREPESISGPIKDDAGKKRQI